MGGHAIIFRLFNGKWQVCVHKRAIRAPDGRKHLWGFPGGGIDRGESGFQAAKREAIEEACGQYIPEAIVNNTYKKIDCKASWGGFLICVPLTMAESQDWEPRTKKNHGEVKADLKGNSVVEVKHGYVWIDYADALRAAKKGKPPVPALDDKHLVGHDVWFLKVAHKELEEFVEDYYASHGNRKRKGVFPDRHKEYRIVAKRSGKVLDVVCKDIADEARVAQWSYKGGANQHFNVQVVGDGEHYQIMASHSKKVLDVPCSDTADGVHIIQYKKMGGDNQHFELREAGDGSQHHYIIAKHSGKALEVRGNDRDDGAEIVQYRLHGADNQLFRFEEA